MFSGSRDRALPELKRSAIRYLILTLLGSGLLQTGYADPAAVADRVRDWRQSHEQQIIEEFSRLLSIPNVASDGVNIRRNAEHIRALLERRGFEVQLLEVDGSPPVVFAERRSPAASRTLMVYAHYDGQPVNAEDWASDPWTPVMRDGPVEAGGQVVPMQAPFDPEWRIFGRSAGDDKAPVIALAAAVDALDASGIGLSVNLKLFLDGEEEAGSPHLEDMLSTHRDRLGADLWLFCDGPAHQSRRWQIVYGVRGTYGFDLTVFGPKRPLHSGHYGNWAPNPIIRLNELIASMRDSRGHILIDGYHDQVVPPGLPESSAIAAAPAVDGSLIEELGIGRPETDDRIEAAILRPAINLRGIRAGDVGTAARNSIPTRATASIGLRLVPDQTPDLLRAVIERHIASQGYRVVHEEPGSAERAVNDRIALVEWEASGYPAYRAPLDQPMAQSVVRILEQLGDQPLIRLPTMGGSLPIYLIDRVMGAPVVILPLANHDNNQHGKDENLRLQNLWDAIEIYAALITGL
jgi:acetylornithine deacetylase/succinyl-diaminopimelate desuccinylase-like protein